MNQVGTYMALLNPKESSTHCQWECQKYQVSISPTFYACLFLYESALRSFSLIKVLALLFFGKRILAQKLLVNC